MSEKKPPTIEQLTNELTRTRDQVRQLQRQIARAKIGAPVRRPRWGKDAVVLESALLRNPDVLGKQIDKTARLMTFELNDLHEHLLARHRFPRILIGPSSGRGGPTPPGGGPDGKEPPEEWTLAPASVGSTDLDFVAEEFLDWKWEDGPFEGELLVKVEVDGVGLAEVFFAANQAANSDNGVPVGPIGGGADAEWHAVPLDELDWKQDGTDVLKATVYLYGAVTLFSFRSAFAWPD